MLPLQASLVLTLCIDFCANPSIHPPLHSVTVYQILTTFQTLLTSCFPKPNASCCQSCMSFHCSRSLEPLSQCISQHQAQGSKQQPSRAFLRGNWDERSHRLWQLLVVSPALPSLFLMKAGHLFPKYLLTSFVCHAKWKLLLLDTVCKHVAFSSLAPPGVAATCSDCWLSWCPPA